MCQHGLAVAADMKTIQSLRRTCFRPIIRVYVPLKSGESVDDAQKDDYPESHRGGSR